MGSIWVSQVTSCLSYRVGRSAVSCERNTLTDTYIWCCSYCTANILRSHQQDVKAVTLAQNIYFIIVLSYMIISHAKCRRSLQKEEWPKLEQNQSKHWSSRPWPEKAPHNKWSRGLKCWTLKCFFCEGKIKIDLVLKKEQKPRVCTESSGVLQCYSAALRLTRYLIL